MVVQIRRLLLSAARDLDLPDGYAPTHAAYTRWAQERDQPNGNQVQALAGRAYRRRAAGGRGWRAPWSEVVQRAGLEVWSSHWVTDVDLIADLRRVSAEMVAEGKCQPGQCPTRSDYRRYGRYDANTVAARLLGEGGQGSWHAVAFRAGLLPPRSGVYRLRPREAVIKDYRRLCRKAGRVPGGPGIGQRSFERQAGYRIHARFGSWAEIVREAGYVPRAQPAHFARTHSRAQRQAA